ncbi:hypothetical protein D3C77_347850 [compost metagenome]
MRRTGLFDCVQQVSVAGVQVLAEQAQTTLMTGQFTQAPVQVVAAADGLELIVAAAFVDEQRHITGGVDGKAIEQLAVTGTALTGAAVLLLEQMQTTVQVEQAGARVAGVTDVEAAFLIEQRLESFRVLAGSPVAEQVIVARVDAVIIAQFVVDQLQGRHRQQAPGDVHAAHGVDQRFLDRVVTVQGGG